MRKLLLLFVSLISAPAYAATIWSQASSDHFVVYSDQPQNDILKFTDQLERYHNALAIRLGITAEKPSPSNRVTIYIVKSQEQVRKLSGDGNQYVAGFYVPRAGGSAAFISRVDANSQDLSFSEIVLLHEYAHHMMYSQTSNEYPLWLSEGFAEYYATASFNKDGSVGLGLPAKHRAAELFFAKSVPIEQLLDTKAYLASKTKNNDEFYGRSWLLFHMLQSSQARKGQLGDYLRIIASGGSELNAAKTAFGDLKILDKDMDRYLSQSKLSYVKISSDGIKPGPIAMRKLSEGESAIMPVRIRSKRGVDKQNAATVLADARKIAEKYPNDPAIFSALAEAEFDAGNDKEAIDAADKAVAVDATQVNAYLQKGYAMARMAKDADNPDAAWAGVRAQFLKLNALENNHPIALIQFYESYREQGKTPSKNAIAGLEWALQLAPFDGGLRWMVAQQEIEQKKYDEAIDDLKPLAFNPHKTDLAEQALALIEQIKTMKAEEKKLQNPDSEPDADTRSHTHKSHG